MPIKLGAVVSAEEITSENLSILVALGFETLNIAFWQEIGDVDLARLAETVANSSVKVSALSVFGNTLMKEETRFAWNILIQNSAFFGSPYVTGFAGRITGKSVEASLDAWKATFSDLLEQAYRYDCPGLLFENCRMGDVWKRGDWNIAINGDAWHLMFEKLADQRLGLEWEPCHQVEALLDPLQQLSLWSSRVKHVHGKDAKVDRSLLSSIGLYASHKAVFPVLPGKGDTDWFSLISILKLADYEGSIDIECEGKSFFTKIEEKKRALEYLKSCL